MLLSQKFTEWKLPSVLTVPSGATTDAGAKPYEMKLPISPIFMRAKPIHLFYVHCVWIYMGE